MPIIGKVVLPGLGSNLGGGLRHATAVQSANWGGYADTNDTFGTVASSWTEPTVKCTGGGGLLGGLLGGPSQASAFWVGLDGYSSTSVEQLGTDSDCVSGKPSYYAWYEMYPKASVVLSSPDVVHPGDHMTAMVVSNANGTSFTLMIKDATANWSFSTTQTGSGFARSSAEVIAEAPSSCNVLFCSELPLADFGQVNYSGSSLADTAGPARFTLVLQRQRDHHGEERHDTGHNEQSQPGRDLVLHDLGQVVTSLPVPLSTSFPVPA